MEKNGTIDTGMRKYLVPKYTRNGKLKGNPKLHKDHKPYRAIVNNIGTPTEKMAEIAEKELNEYVESTPSYLKDTTDFLCKLKEVNEPLPKDPILFCFDVVKLYLSIPREEGMQACQNALETRTDKTVGTEEVMAMIKTILENNVFEFDGNEYIQTEGVAIGSKLGRNFACAYMRQWDEMLEQCEKQPMFYKRFIDDGFGIWAHGVEELVKFQTWANGIHPNIQVELRWSHTEIEFLDTLVKIVDGNLVTDLFTKKTDKHLYVQVKSSHPASVKRAIPYGLGIRMKRICSKTEDYEKHRQELKTQLRKRGYSGKFIEAQLQRVDRLNRQDFLVYKDRNKKKQERVPLVLTYMKQLPEVGEIVRKNMDTLYKSEHLKEVFKQPPMLAYRRDGNLGDMLVHCKLNKVMRQRSGSKFMRCRENCKVYELLEEGCSEGQDLGREDKCNCLVRNVVYGIHCNKCKRMMYVGETSRTVGERLKEHMADIRLGRDRAVAHHFRAEIMT